MKKNFLFLVFVFCIKISSSQAPKGFSSVKQEPDKEKGKTYALIIGISRYNNPAIPELEYADKDARAFYDYLKANGTDTSNVVLLLNEKARLTDIMTNLYELCIDSVKRGDKFYFYFSGHGDVESKVITNAGYLLPYDVSSVVYSFSAIDMRKLQDYIITASARGAEVIFITDACHSGKLAGGTDGLRNIQNLLKENWKEEIKILSCQPGELSLEGKQWGNGRGLFSYVLIKGLAGEADSNNDGMITLHELSQYLGKEIPEKAKPYSQYPMISGNMQAQIASVNNDYLSMIRSVDTSLLSMVNLKGMEAGRMLHELPDSIRTSYGLFREYLDSGIIYLKPPALSAFFYYSKIPDTEATHALCGLMKKNYAVASMNFLDSRLSLLLSNKKVIYSFEDFQKLIYHARALRLVFGDEKLNALGFLSKAIFTESLEGVLNSVSPEARKTAIMKLDSCTRLDPNGAYLYFMRGEISLFSNDIDNAIKDEAKAIELSSRFILPYILMARAYSEKGMHDTAIKIFNRIIEMDSSFTFISQIGIALEHFSTGRLLAAQKNLRKGFRYNNSLTDIGQKRDNFLFAAFGCYQLRYYSKAISFFKKHLDYSPADNNSYYLMACSYSMMNHKKKALYYLEQSIKAGMKDFDNIQQTSALNNLRKEPGFRKLIDMYFPGQL